MHVESFPRRTLPVLLLGAALAVACGGSPPGEQPVGETGTETLSSTSGSAAQARYDCTGNSGGGGTDKVLVCHIPPGNPANAHPIEVGAPAVEAHLAHGDTVGCCPGVEVPVEPDTGTVPACVAAEGSCGEGVGTCCEGLTCGEQSTCVPPTIG
ncbi:MAG: hypothetical protein L0Y66_01755 [Myxococcaceae bacterium]|nr:hypothetical protein [Myxococcaceae bacterium]MCI0670145.1 hypothetical protein [Myxococcaceae bacterium]